MTVGDLGHFLVGRGHILWLLFTLGYIAFVQSCQMAKFDPFLSLDCARVEGVGRNPRRGRDQILQRSVAEP